MHIEDDIFSMFQPIRGNMEEGNNQDLNININNIDKRNTTLCETYVRKRLRHLDLSKNKCKMTVDAALINIIKHIDLDTLDISQNFEFPGPDDEITKIFKNSIMEIQERIKIIY